MPVENIRKKQTIMLGLEAVAGTEVTPSRSYSFIGDIGGPVQKDWLTRNDEASGTIDDLPPDGGRIRVDDVPLNFKMGPEDIVYPLLGFVGKVTSAQLGSSIAYKHTFETDTTAALPKSFTFEIFDTVNYLRLNMMRLKNLGISVDAAGHVFVNTAWVGSRPRIIEVGDSTAVAFSSLRRYKFDDIEIKIGDVSTFANQATYTRIEKIDLTPTRGVEGIPTFDRSAFITEFGTSEGRKMEGNSFVQKYTSATMRELFWGAAGAIIPDSSAEYKSMEINFIGDLIAGTSYYYTVTLKFPLVHIASHNMGDETLRETIEFNCYYDRTSGYFMTAEVTNTSTAVT